MITRRQKDLKGLGFKCHFRSLFNLAGVIGLVIPLDLLKSTLLLLEAQEQGQTVRLITKLGDISQFTYDRAVTQNALGISHRYVLFPDERLNCNFWRPHEPELILQLWAQRDSSICS